MLSSLAVGYFQYLNAYQEKVSSQAKEDMASATATFTEISRAFSEMQGLAANAVFRFYARRQATDPTPATQALATKNAHAISERYEKARIALRENIDVLTRKAEVYIDWASDIYRDPADKHNVDDDPLSRRVLRDYAFDCSDKYNFPAFGNVMRRTTIRPPSKSPTVNIAPSPRNGASTTMTRPRDAFVRICAGPNDKDAKSIYK